MCSPTLDWYSFKITPEGRSPIYIGCALLPELLGQTAGTFVAVLSTLDVLSYTGRYDAWVINDGRSPIYIGCALLPRQPAGG